MLKSYRNAVHSVYYHVYISLACPAVSGCRYADCDLLIVFYKLLNSIVISILSDDDGKRYCIVHSIP